ncbi:MFS general substrate transporter [Aureobasidium namibiae CBS 147.97]|uniref:MFS general substrate transporter n=1 Tax=Aureobasidium namibiae CBS 147.97 TaxID=1043004 RepID=A0A074W4P9_9PEZI
MTSSTDSRKSQTSLPIVHNVESDKKELKAADLASETPAPSYAEGGTRAWLVVLGCWCVAFASFGIVNTFGIYETYYLRTYLRDYSPSTVAWIGSLQAWVQLSATLISGPISDRYGPLVIVLPFSLSLVIGMMLTSLCTKFYQFFLCQGVLLGVSSGLIYAPALSVVGHFFFEKRAMAMSIASSGSPLGGIIYPIILNNLIPKIGFGWAQRVCGFLSLFLLCIAALTLRPLDIKRKGSFILLEAFKKPAYSLQTVALFLVLLGFFSPYFYLADYGLAHGVSPHLTNYLFAFLNAGSLVGRVGGGFVALNLGMFNATVFACFAAALLMFCWLAITSTGGLIVFALLFGATSGMIIALIFPVIAHMADHPSQMGTYLGQATFVFGFAALGGAPIVGALFSAYPGYEQGIIFSASVMMAGAVLITGARYLYAPDKLLV